MLSVSGLPGLSASARRHHAMSALYVILAIVAVLGLLAGQMLVLRYKWMEYASASLQTRARRPHVFIRTLLACFVSGVYVVACCIVYPAHPQAHWGIMCVLYCVPAVIFYVLVPLPPVWLIATFGTRASRIMWSLFFGVLSWLIVRVLLEFFAVYSVFYDR